MANDTDQPQRDPAATRLPNAESGSSRKPFRDGEETANVLLNAAPTAAFLIDVAGIILFANHLAATRIGIAAERMIGHPIADFLPPAVAEFRRQKGLEVIREGRPVFFEDSCDNRFYSSSVHPICDESGRVVKLAIHSKDITEEKRSEEERRKLTVQLQQAQKMEAIGTLAGGIAHDFNNLLMAIQGNVSLMLFDTPVSHTHHRTLMNIEKLVRSGADLTSKLLGYARKGKYEARPILLNDLVAETADTFGRMRKEIIIEREFAPDLKGIIVDRGQIEQVLLNMFVNAADAMPSGGRLLLKTDNVTHREGVCAFACRRLGGGDRPYDYRSHLRPLFHHKKNGPRHRPGARLGLWDRQKPQRLYRRGVAAGGRGRLFCLFPGHRDAALFIGGPPRPAAGRLGHRAFSG